MDPMGYVEEIDRFLKLLITGWHSNRSPSKFAAKCDMESHWEGLWRKNGVANGPN